MKHFSIINLLALLFSLLAAAPIASYAQAPAWEMAIGIGDESSAVEVHATTIDANGNVYLAGTFGGVVRFGSAVLNGSGDVFVAKWSPVSKNFVWAKQAGSRIGLCIARAIALNGNNVYIAGDFETPDDSPAYFENIALTSTGNADIFVAKLTDAGNTATFTWAQRAGGKPADFATGIAVNGANVYVVGTFIGPTADFGNNRLTNTDNVGISNDLFVTKLTDAGSTSNFTWAQRAGGLGSDIANGIAIEGEIIYVTGSFSGNGPANFGSTVLNAAGTRGASDVFVTKLIDGGPTGSFTWAQRAGGTDSESANAIAVSGTSIYIAGGFGSADANFGTSTLASAGRSDVFISKLTDMGNAGSFVWAQRAGGAGNEYASALAVNGANVYVAGDFSGVAASFGSSILASLGSDMPNSGVVRNDGFVAKLMDAGSGSSFQWAQRAGGGGNDVARTVAIDGKTLYVAGQVDPPAGFGNYTINTGGFLASLTDAVLTPTTPAHAAIAISLYPNPARITTTVILPVMPSARAATLTLLDALGRAVRTYTISLPPTGRQHELALTGLPAGIYALRVTVAGISAMRRLVVE